MIVTRKRTKCHCHFHCYFSPPCFLLLLLFVGVVVIATKPALATTTTTTTTLTYSSPAAFKRVSTDEVTSTAAATSQQDDDDDDDDDDGDNNVQKMKNEKKWQQQQHDDEQFEAKPTRRQRQGQDKKEEEEEALVVCGVDGTVYTIDAWTGQLRGMFTSLGGPLVSASDSSEDEDEVDGGGDDIDTTGGGKDDDVDIEEAEEKEDEEEASFYREWGDYLDGTGITDNENGHKITSRGVLVDSSNNEHVGRVQWRSPPSPLFSPEDDGVSDVCDTIDYSKEEVSNRADTKQDLRHLLPVPIDHENDGVGYKTNKKTIYSKKSRKKKSTKTTTKPATTTTTSKTTTTTRVVPGLDGRIYTLTTTTPPSSFDRTIDNNEDNYDNIQLDVLPMSIMDVVEQPVSACRPSLPLDEQRHHDKDRGEDFGNNGWQYDFDSYNDQDDDDDHDQKHHQQQCVLVTGAKSTSLYALDPITGTVKWVRGDSGSSHGAAGITSLNNKKNNKNNNKNNKSKKQHGGRYKRKKQTILLQREDYIVKQIDVDTGEEMWNVTMGRFSALDFPDSMSSSTSVSESSSLTSNFGDGRHEGRRGSSSRSSNSRRTRRGDFSSTRRRKKRTTTTTTKGTGTVISRRTGKVKAGGLPLLPNRARDIEDWYENQRERRRNNRRRTEEMGGEEEEEILEGGVDHDGEDEGSSSSFGGGKGGFYTFPSIAFGEDGMSITAFDGATGALLWKRRIESVVAAVYGVGRENSWVSIDVVDEQEVQRHGSNALVKAFMLSLGDGIDKQGHHAELPAGKEFADRDFLSLPGDVPGSNNMPAVSLPFSEFGLEARRSESDLSIVPYHEGGIEETQDFQESDYAGEMSQKFHFARLGRHYSTVFVASTSQSQPKCTNPQISQSSHEKSRFPLLEGGNALGTKSAEVMSLLPSGEVKILDSINSSGRVSSSPLMPTKTHRTEHGLFLTWQAVTLIVFLLLAAAGLGRLAYLTQKRKWKAQNTPPLVPTNPNSSEDDVMSFGSHRSGKSRSRSSPTHLSLNGEDSSLESSILPLRLNYPLNRHFSSSAPKKAIDSSIVRSISLPYLNSLNTERSNDTGQPVARAVKIESRSLAVSPERTKSNPGTEEGKFSASSNMPELRATTIGTTAAPTTRNAASNTNAASNLAVSGSQQQKGTLHLGVSRIDGVPLVRYSRYRSEFKELSPLGKGGFGTVFRCVNALDAREYAIKKIWIKSYVDSSGRVTGQFSQKLQRVLREVKILALLDHPNIVRYYTAWLELEDEDARIDDDTSTWMASSDQRPTKCFSSELLTGAAPSASEYESWTRSWRSKRPSKLNPHRGKSTTGANGDRLATSTIKANPLGWNNFWTDGSSSTPFDITSDDPKRNWVQQNIYARRSSSSIDEADLGFNWERSSSGISKEHPLDHRSLADQCHLSVVEDDEERPSNDNREDVGGGMASSNSRSSMDSENDSDAESSASSEFEARRGPINQERGNERGSIISSNPFTAVSASERSHSAQQSRSKSLASHIPVKNQRHILYIQMQLCSQKTLADFLTDAQARKGSASTLFISVNSDNAVDIPYALRMFSQIARGVKHVHRQGLIHRDLKPSNCFIDDSGVVKIGDFGLSRESATTGEIGKGPDEEKDEVDEIPEECKRKSSLGGTDDNTVGVGTRSYASPEQMSGSDYDASTDVYSLGIILFELCYPMCTGMERHMVFKGIRRRVFPDQWHSSVAVSFPRLHTLITAMLSPLPSERPSSATVADEIEALLGEYTVLSLDRSRWQEGSVLLRVEAVDSEGVLQRAIKIIKEAAPDVTILQYGLRGQANKTIMEFALSKAEDIKKDDADQNEKEPPCLRTDDCMQESIHRIILKLEESKEILVVRQVAAS